MSLQTRLLLALLLFPASTLAQQPYVPDELADWRQWVLEDKEYRECPFVFDTAATQRNDFVCAWPGTLELSVDAQGGRFSQPWSVYAGQQWVPLPGDVNYWPHQVTANGRDVAVVLRDGVPSVYLGAGQHRIAGSFGWDERPGILRLSRQTGLIELSVDGRAVARPERNNAGIFLGERKQETQARNNVTTSVYRLVRDDVPTRLTTRLQVQVSGSVREELFGPLLPDGFVPLTITSDLPARLEADGMLRVQVRPGSWEIELTARAAGVLVAVTMPVPASNLADTEIWSYQANDSLRVTAPEGLPPVDPLQVNVPDPWSELPAFRVTAGESLAISERSRGRVSVDNDLSLERTMWLDFDRSGFIVSDQISGAMRSDWRLDMSPPFALLTASADGDNLLITDGANDGQTGVEVRQPNLDIETIAESARYGVMPATGWDTRFNDVAAVLNLPPGHKLLAAPGVDVADGSWVSRWQLLDFFLVLIIAIAAWRLFGPRAGIIALAALVLSYHEMYAPAWLWLNVLIAIALLRVAPAGGLRRAVRVYQLVSVAALLLTLVPFVAGQLRVAIYPQLEEQRSVLAQIADGFASADKAVQGRLDDAATYESDMETRELQRTAPRSVKSAALEEVVVMAQPRAPSYARYAPNAIVQAGAGIPSWQWNTYRLSWSGPVDSEQTMRLIILPRWLVSSLRVIEVLMLLLFVAVLAAEILKRRFRLPGGLQIGATASSALAAIGLATLLIVPGGQAAADVPGADILKELETRLLQAPECTPRCAEVVAADIGITANSVRMQLSVHALEDVAVPLPGSDGGWRPAAILLDGAAAGQVSRGPAQALWIRLPAGRHNVVLSGPIPATDSLEIPFPAPPRVVTARADGWFIAGIKDRRLLSGSLQLTRLQTEGSGDGAVRWESSRFPPFVQVRRTLQLDLDWTVQTTVTRIAPAQGALTLELPLLDGESVLVENMTARDGKLLVTMAPNQDVVAWQSNLERQASLELHAVDGAPWQEVWQFGVSNVWHAEFSGVPESENQAAPDNARLALFYPRGGESLQLETTRPEGSAGSTLAFDSVDLHARHGDRSSDVTMTLRYRSTRGAQHAMRIPADAEVTDVVIDGERQSLRAADGQLTVPILPGEHTIVLNWRNSGEVATRTSTPAVDIAAPAGNIALRMELPRNRWLLGTQGPRLGPAVLYWSELAVLLLAAVILGRTALAPLKTWHWLLLGVGFSTFAWPALGWVVAWLLAAGARERWDGVADWWQFNLVQVAFAGLTIIALSSIAGSLPGGLLGVPDMHVTGNGSYGNNLQWFADQSDAALPTAAAWSVPLWVYKAFILAWALWLSFALLRWLPWVWRCFTSHGYWRPRERRVAGSGEGGRE